MTTKTKPKAAPSAQLPDISDDAKMLLACTFMLGMTALNYKMQQGRPSDRAQVALDELVRKGVLIKESINGAGGIGFKPKGYDLASLKPWFNKHKNDKAMGFPLVQPL